MNRDEKHVNAFKIDQKKKGMCLNGQNLFNLI